MFRKFSIHKRFALITAYAAAFLKTHNEVDTNWLTKFSYVVKLGNKMKLKLRLPPFSLVGI